MFGPGLLFAACSSPFSLGEDDPALDFAEVVAPPGVAERIDSVPVYGGTLEPVQALDGLVAADPQSDRLLKIVGDDATVIDLGDNARPFRLHVEDTDVWVTLRGTGELARVDLTTDTVVWRAHVCTEPRGVARSQTGQLVVACADGPLVEVDNDGHIVRSILLDTDLRDVVPVADVLFVSRFTTAEVLLLDPVTLEIVRRDWMRDDGRVAWRMRANDDVGVLVLHDIVPQDIVFLSDEPLDTGGFGGEQPGAYGSASSTPCGHLHESVITRVNVTETAPRTIRGASMNDILVTDFAVGPTGEVGVAATGAPKGSPAANLYLQTDLLNPFSGCRVGTVVPVDPAEGRATAVAFDAEGKLVVQTVAPFAIVRMENGERHALAPTRSSPDDEAVTDFHTATPAGVACASCHPEGTDDANVWVFMHAVADPDSVSEIRRTMPLAGKLLSRTPYHWDAGLADAEALMLDTFTGRMGGGIAPPEQIDTLFAWLDGLRPVRGNAGRTPPVIEHGRAVFTEAGCAVCHAGPAFTDGTVHLVRRLSTDENVKTPSLLGVGSRARLLHDGCAQTLEDRFERPCDDQLDTHGKLSILSDNDIDALTAYLRTL